METGKPQAAIERNCRPRALTRRFRTPGRGPGLQGLRSIRTHVTPIGFDLRGLCGLL